MSAVPLCLILAPGLVVFGCSSTPADTSAGDSGGSGTGSSTSTTVGANGGSGGVATSSGTNGGSTHASASSSGGAGGSDSSASTGAGGSGGMAARGATLPYWEYEAEGATTTGTILAPSRNFGDPAGEASARSAVRLDGAGQKVAFKIEHPTNSIVVRYSIPDSPNGGGLNATLGLYVNGVRTQSLNLTSRYAWTYGDADAQGSASEVPSAGTPHHFYDEAHALLGEVPVGATIALQRDPQDTATYYIIDLVDFEEVAAPIQQPANSLSITDYGATPDDASDDTGAIATAIGMAQEQNKVLWIPKGTFETGLFQANGNTPKFNVSGITIRGAGMWYSVLHGFGSMFALSGNNNQFSDFAVFGDIPYRDDTKGWQGFDGPAGTGSRIDSVWIEHETVGWLAGKNGVQGQITTPLTNGLVMHGVRIRDTYADGVNFSDATANSIIEQSSFRNTGDDSIATWSFSGDGPLACSGNIFRFNTVQTVWRANCYAIYGGTDNSIQDSVCADTSNYPGILVASSFSALPFGGTTTVERNTLTRAGGPHYNQQFGALRIFADTGAVSNVNVSDILVDSPTFSGLHFAGSQGISGVVIDGMQIENYGTSGILVSAQTQGSAQINNVVVTGSANKGLENDAAGFNLQKGSGDTGW